MMRQMEASHDNVIGYSLSGDVSDEEYRQVASQLRDAIAQHGHIRLLFRLSDLSLQSFVSAMSDRFRFVREHGDDIDRVAIVSDDKATELATKATGAIAPAETEHFSRDEEERAWTWLE